MGKIAIKFKKTGLVILFFIGILITTLSIYGIGANKLTSEIPKIKKLGFVVSPTTTPFLFSEMTIPAMRSRGYDSKLNELSKYSENSSYTSYLTSYGSDGFKINGLLTIPKGNKPANGYPAVVFVHGYIAPTIYKTTERYGDYVNYLARNGFVVFKIDLRGHGDSEGDASGAYYSADYVVDTLNAYSALQNFDVVNPKTIGLWGHSMSGNVVFRAFTVKPEIPAVVIWAGSGYSYTDLQEYRISDNSYRPPLQNTQRARKRQLLRDAHGDFNSNSEFWKQVVPTNYVNDLKGAIQLNHAINDNVVSIEYSRNLEKILGTTNIFHELNEYPSGGHNITGPYFVTAMQNTVNFYKKYLGS
ncbi:MAG: Dipeptidylaminopeptidase/acylaminoacyl-peptidase [Microgenomates group bacterium GW2011_GWC1_37_12b]|uniref:Dipeptidylaminopeptidase/acylaminoacyl-peptidase n=2 Tax=Candidatus Woeseibacteriota TaxID=1752722 RepID=A0A0G0L3Y1_9BACT|nr:MAG: Dipeptidylaminopeptidase/acylaminoacyl-peptidase [Microgenomates group bacterium GW2011_GWC1_37_12b]KKQ86678.1 MAG: Dipeptidylaminopeptidase/acylaminoacyl-peptidase [Candidatus Woesebacteria bacterium GW2011_GWB1_38_8b]